MSIQRAILILLCIVIAACDQQGDSSKIKRTFTVGVLSGLDIFNPSIRGFQDRLTELGYQEGIDIKYEIQRANGSAAAMQRIADEFVEKNVDLIFTSTNGAALAAKSATVKSKIPVVFTIVMGPVESGVVDSLARPTGNITGVRNPLGEFIGKRLGILKQISPEVKSVLVLNDPDYPTYPIAIRGLRNAARELHINLIEVPVKSLQDINQYLLNRSDPDFDAVIIMPDTTVQSPASLGVIFDFAKNKKLPILANTPSQADSGALFSYLSDSYNTGREAARLANEVLANRPANTQPVTSSEPRLILNLRAARELGLDVSDGLVSLAHRIIE